MRGSLKQRYPGSWSMILDLGYEHDPATGKNKRKQKWVSFRGTRKQAETKLTELVGAADRHEFVEPSKLTLVEWLRTWLEQAVKPPMRRPATYRVYKYVIEGHIATSSLASIPLQKLRATDLERYYVDLDCSPATVTVHHAVLHRALKQAKRDQLVSRNVAADVETRPRATTEPVGARDHCWSAIEARRFLDAAKNADTQSAAFYATALDTGARRSEMCGLRWANIDLDAATILIAQQLTTAGEEPTFGPTKTGGVRPVAIGAETVVLLRCHKRAQATLKLQHRTAYRDFGLVFARESEHLRTEKDKLGMPLPVAHFGRNQFGRVVKAAGVRRIRFHGLRHTSATLLLQAGTPVHVVAQRLGHKGVEMTLNTYAHALPDAQADAAMRLGALLHG